jgi:trans-2,3-dihydro-3-hydroxyanthranilate isomerase
MRFRYYICDVFTTTRFGGNQLAVLPEAEGLTDRQMQAITREFNFAESSFVFPPKQGHTRQVRIFTPATEVPFAGHPNVGTAFVLATIGELGQLGQMMTVKFEEKAGVVPIRIERRGELIWCELTAPERLSLGNEVSVQSIASAVSLSPGDFVTTTHAPQVASVGLPFIMAELNDRAALARSKINMTGFDELRTQAVTADVHLYVRDGAASAGDFNIHARMFAPLDGVPEDPATGSANCALSAMLTRLDDTSSGTFCYRISQGVDMGRPSVLEARAEKRDGEVVSSHIGGACVLVSEGWITVD